MITHVFFDEIEEKKGPQKTARIRVPRIKFVEATIENLWPVYSTSRGRYSITLYEDEESFERNDKVIVIEGDSLAVEPIIHAVMQIVHG